MNIRKICNPRNIIFREEDHKYFSEGNPDYISVTTLLKRFTPEFPLNMAERYAKKRNLDPKWVQQKWDDQRNLGTEIGSWLHINLENQLQGKIPDLRYLITEEPTEQKKILKARYLANYRIQIKNYLEFVKDMDYLGSEIIVGDKDRAGQIDTLFSSCIHDFKNDKEILFEKFYINWRGDKVHKKMYAPFEDLDDCNWNKYCLQVNLYHSLLTEEIKNCFSEPHKIIKFDRYSQEYEIFEIPDWQDRIKQLIK